MAVAIAESAPQAGFRAAAAPHLLDERGCSADEGPPRATAAEGLVQPVLEPCSLDEEALPDRRIAMLLAATAAVVVVTRGDAASLLLTDGCGVPVPPALGVPLPAPDLDNIGPAVPPA